MCESVSELLTRTELDSYLRTLRTTVAALLNRTTLDEITAAIGQELRERARVLLSEFHDPEFAEKYTRVAEQVEMCGDRVTVDYRI